MTPKVLPEEAQRVVTNANLQVVILCGGMGTRLAELTEAIPKPMVHVGGKPILWHIMKTYSHHGFHDFVLCLGYKGEQIRSYFTNYPAMNSDLRVNIGTQKIEILESLHDEKTWTVTLAETGETTPTGGRVKRAAKYLDGQRFMVTYGDGVGDVDVKRLVAFHEAHGKLATVTGVHPVARFGELRVASGNVTEFHEKPEVRDGWVNGGYFVFERRVLDYLDDDVPLERAPLERLAQDGELAMYPHGGFWQPMDTLRDVRALNEMWADSRAPWRVW